MKYFFLFFSMFYTLGTSAQKEDHQWIFNATSIDDCNNHPNPDRIVTCGASILDFNTLPPRAYRDTAITLDMDATQAIYCGPDGLLEMYTNGQSIHGGNHRPLINGDSINYTPKWDWLTWENENGEVKPSGFRISQGAGIIPIPDSNNEYLLLYENYERSDSNNSRDELWAGMIRQNDNGKLEVIYKDSLITDRMYARGKLTACKHGNGRDWWFHVFDADTVYTYLVDPTGLNLSHTQLLPISLDQSLGQVKYSPDGSKFALFGGYAKNNKIWYDFMIADFDRCTGSFSNIILESSDDEDDELSRLGNGLSFSPDGKLLYWSTGSTIFQYDLESGNIFDSQIVVAERDGSLCELFNRTIFFSQLQLGPDNKIYIGIGTQCTAIHIINRPNVRGVDCDFQQSAVPIPTFHGATIPNVNTYRLGPLDGSACDTLELDNNPVSRFWYEQDSTDFLTAQFWDVSYFRPEQWSWDFGDGNTSSDIHPIHQFDEKGTYEVCLTVSNENNSNTSCQTLNIGTTSTTENNIDIDFTIFPNPTKGLVRCHLKNYLPESGKIKIYNTAGQFFKIEEIRVGVKILDISNLDSGTYIYQFLEGKEILKTGKIVKF